MTSRSKSRLLQFQRIRSFFFIASLTLSESFVHRLPSISNFQQVQRKLSSEPLTVSDDTVKKSTDIEALKRLDDCTSGSAAKALLENFTGDDCLYSSISIPPGASDRGISDGDLAIQTKIRNKKYGIFDLIDLNGNRDADRASAGVLGVFLASSLSAIAANQNLPGPEIFRFVVVWVLSFAPLALVGYGIATPDNLQALLVSIQRELFPTYRKRMIQHEAGHFLMSHLLGFPIKSYSANAVKNAVEFYPLSEKDAGLQRAKQLGFDKPLNQRVEDFFEPPSESVPYYSKDGSGGSIMDTQSVFRNAKNYTDNPFLRLSSQDEPKESWPFRGFNHQTIDQLAAISVAGVCAEILAFGNAEGGVADFSQLRSIFSSAEPELTEREMENRIRYSVGYSMTQLRLHLGALDRLSEVMSRGGSVSECVAAIETCDNVSGADGIFGDYELRRRKEFKNIGTGIIEKLFLGEKNADTEEDRLIEGKGGGYRKRKEPLIRISGDDPLYIALGISCLFVAWATNGGLSLH
ncbi:MAG: hypothetical protein SGBAC_003254 [Bacillariaceae sp.]